MSRIRRRPGTKEEILTFSPPLVLKPEEFKGKWYSCFNNSNPLHLELGMGKGTFVRTLAEQNPDINYLGLELREEVLLAGIKNSLALPKNLGFIWTDIKEIDRYFGEDEVERIYINFCDPWPKVRHAKRRLTHSGFLNIYKKVLVRKGEIHLKTDNEQLFEFSLNEFANNNWKLQNISLNLYNNLPENNIPTEYELKYVSKGLPIYRLEAKSPFY
ncbi:MAG: tRNA (guanosine(46)-N7)-methyltransferase TrmB [Bacillota bacterium]